MSTVQAAPEDLTLPEVAEPLLAAGPAIHQDPDWMREAKAAAWENFQVLPMPSRANEEWRFSSLKQLDLSGYHVAPELSKETTAQVLERSHGLAASGRFVFANDRMIQQEALGESLRQQGVVWLPLEQAWQTHGDLVRKYFMREKAILGGAKFSQLHAAQVRTGSFLYIPRGVSVELPFEAWHWLATDQASVFPHTLIVAEANSQVTVVDHFESLEPQASGFACGVNDLWLGDGAQVTYVCAQNWSSQALGVQINSTVVGRDASARALTVNTGARYCRSESVSHLRAPGGRSDMLAVTVAEESQEFDLRTFQIHEAPNTSSDLLYKNALDNQARTIFSGLIRVAPGAHKTDAYQKVRNLLLSDEAEANSMPGLEIEADDVRCTHGATSGQIEEEEVFYLRSRGIPLKDAQRLIVHGFLGEVIERLNDDAIASLLADRLHRKFDVRH